MNSVLPLTNGQLSFNVIDFLRYEPSQSLPLAMTNGSEQSMEAEQERTFIEQSTKECIFYLVGSVCGQKVSSVVRLNCQCGPSSSICQFCIRANQLDSGFSSPTYNELQQALEWVDINSCLSHDKFGIKASRGCIDNLASINWASNETVCLVGDKIAHYTLTKFQREL